MTSIEAHGALGIAVSLIRWIHLRDLTRHFRFLKARMLIGGFELFALPRHLVFTHPTVPLFARATHIQTIAQVDSAAVAHRAHHKILFLCVALLVVVEDVIIDLIVAESRWQLVECVCGELERFCGIGIMFEALVCLGIFGPIQRVKLTYRCKG